MTDQPSETPHEGNLAEWLRWAETKITLSLAVTLYFKPPPSSFAEGLLACYRDYLELCEPHLRWYASDPGGRYRRADAKALRIPFRRLPEAVDRRQFFAWQAFAGDHYLDAAPYQFAAVTTPKHDGALSKMRAAFPVEMFSNDFRRFLHAAKAFAAHVPFFFGTAGLSFSEAMETARRQFNRAHLVPVAMRFSGVDVEYNTSTSFCCKEAIKGVNWLTLLSHPFVEKLGGKEALRARLSEAIDLHALPAGVMIQAGPAPGVGDINAEERLPPYREVHHALTPVRIADHWVFEGRGFDEEKTRRWMRRFDD